MGPKPSHPPLILRNLIWTAHKEARKERPAYPVWVGISRSPCMGMWGVGENCWESSGLRIRDHDSLTSLKRIT